MARKGYTIYCGGARGRTFSMREAVIVGKHFAMAENEPGFEVYCELLSKSVYFDAQVRVPNGRSTRPIKAKVI